MADPGGAMQETLVGAALAFLGSLVLAIGAAIGNLFFRVVALETNQKRDAEMLTEIRGDVKKLLVANGVPDGND
jgi:hypothetical protein